MQAIEVSHLTKEYRLGALQSFKQTALNAGARLLGRPAHERPLFKALDDVSFSIEPGEVVGIIGHNGAGKSTLLKMLARISTPSSGSVKVKGRISPLIEVGAGFVPDFTGRENVYLNGTILGMSKKEIDRKFDEIVDFAEMAEFIDTPVKRYSSGMQVKLAFAVATSVESEILIVDEVLAVGDLAFQRKCFDRMEDLIKREGRTVLLVSHNLRQVQRLCQRAILLNRGKISAQGSAQDVCDAFFAQSDKKILTNASHKTATTESSGEVSLLSVVALDNDGTPTDSLQYGQDCTFRFKIRVSEQVPNLTFGFGFHTTDLLYLTTHNSECELDTDDLTLGDHNISIRVKDLRLVPGAYSVRFGISVRDTDRTLFYGENMKQVQVLGSIPISMRRGFFTLNAGWYMDTIETELNLESLPHSS
jgi:lipopolysaccharide transport system ATP-binding protein